LVRRHNGLGKFPMSFSSLLAISAVVAFISMILYIIFGQVTVRKLRKNPATKYALGIEFVSGWDIINVAGALALPKTIVQKIKRNSISMGLGQGFEANPDLLYKHTTRFDRLLARLFYWSWASSGVGLIALTLAYFLFGLGQN